MRKRTKIKFWAALGKWQYDLLYTAGKAMRLFKRFCRRYSERGGMILSILLFMVLSWGLLFFLLNMLFGNYINLVGGAL